jgi:hypothetical protein
MVHVVGCALIEVAVTIFQGIFRCPYSRGEFVAVEVGEGCTVYVLG